MAAPARSSLVLGGAPCLGGQSAVFGAVTEGHGAAGRLAAVGLERGEVPRAARGPRDWDTGRCGDVRRRGAARRTGQGSTASLPVRIVTKAMPSGSAASSTSSARLRRSASVLGRGCVGFMGEDIRVVI